ncbi:MAG: hypothetical protein FWD09_08070, partial [Lentimicrobiaceae bacterium]|nr:hypothetical protein [Lentimicrobiaceae bacterium]
PTTCNPVGVELQLLRIVAHLRRADLHSAILLPRAAPTACTGLFTLHTCGVSLHFFILVIIKIIPNQMYV